jgi:LmbE family N-acetylglucosaminyl deacetylase
VWGSFDWLAPVKIPRLKMVTRHRGRGANSLINGLLFGLAVWCFPAADRGNADTQPGSGQIAPDSRFKTDILLVVAHPDDEADIASYLAREVFDEHRRVSVVFATRGGSGGNHVGLEQGAALADVREIEAREALSALNIHRVWFLAGRDTPGQDVLHSLETWNHGANLESLVRLIRLTRPEIILTMLPNTVVGENHEDHQAAAVLAVEAADQAGDALVFPEQVTAPREARKAENYGEGLSPWQTKKIYFFDIEGAHDFSGLGPRFRTDAISPSQHVPYSLFTERAWSSYATQNEYDLAQLRQVAALPVQLILGKSYVHSSVTGDCFEGITAGAIAYTPSEGSGTTVSPLEPGSVALDGPWAFYKRFWRSHGLQSMERLVQPEAQVIPGQRLWVPLLIHNPSGESAQLVLSAQLPSGWSSQDSVRSIYLLGPHESRAVELYLQAPARVSRSPQELTWSLARGTSTDRAVLRIYFVKHAMPQ